MEDLKQIQEFFSKPLEEVTKSQMLKKAKKGSYPATLVAIENGKVVAQEKVNTPQEAPAAHSVMAKKYPNAKIRLEDSTGKILEENVFVEAFKLEKALKGMGYNVKVKYLDDFGKDIFEIYFNNPADADDDSIFYDAKKLGYDNIRVFANPQESLDEAYIVTYAKNKGERPSSAAYKLRDSALAFIRDLEKDGYTTMLTQRPVDGVDESVSEADLNDPVAMKMREAKMKADKLAKMRAANAGDDGNDKFFEKSTARLRKLKALKDKRAQIMRDMEQEAELEGGPVADKYGDMLNKLDKAISMLDEAVNDPRIDNSKFGPSPRKFAELRAQMGDEALLDKIQMLNVNVLVDVLDELSLMQESTIVNEYDVYMPSQEEVDQFFEKETHLQTHYLNAKPVMGQEGSFNKTEIQPWDEYDYSNWKNLVAKSLKEVQKGHGEKVSKDFFSKLQGKVINYKGEDYKVVSSDDAVLKMQDSDGKFKSINLNQFNTSGLIKEIMETIKLGKQLNEKLCKKGEAYRKKRMAAGEKSSAYLSGRAVKVCKGQMKG